MVSFGRSLLTHRINNEYGNKIVVVVRDGEIIVKPKTIEDRKYGITTVQRSK